MFAAAFGLLVFGMVVYVSAPSNPGHGFWTPERLIWGVLPVCASIVLFAYAARYWAKAHRRRRIAWLLAGVFLVPITAIFYCVLYWTFRSEPDAGIDVSWDSKSSSFNWGRGQVKLPRGFTYTPQAGIDSAVGEFSAESGRTIIRHDIGELGGGGPSSPQVSEMLIEGSRVRLGRETRLNEKGKAKFRFELQFPDSGCAKFWLETFDESDRIVIASLANSFRPAGGAPSWVRPLLPEVLRSDCRLVPNPEAQF